MKPSEEKFVIVKDTREQLGWNFEFFDCCTVEEEVLTTGDYTVRGLEDIVVLERKSLVCELAQNLGSDWRRFEAEFDRLIDFEHKYIICEFSLEDVNRFPVGSGIPKKLWKKLRINSKYIKNKLFEETANRDIQVIFAGNKDRAEETAIDIFKKVIRKYGKEE